MKEKLGYACINSILDKRGYSYSKSVKLATLQSKGLDYYVEEKLLPNLDNLLLTLKWNEEMGIKIFRISNSLFSHRNRYRIQNLPHYRLIKEKLETIGDFVYDHGHRISFHADHFSVLASQKPHVVENAVIDLNFFSEIFDIMQLDASPFYKINVHVNTTAPSKEEAAQNFIKGFNKLDENTKKRLTVENDDKLGGFSTNDLYNLICKNIDIPIVFDYLHHKIHDGGLSEEEALKLALSTWKGIRPIVHFASQKKLYEDEKSKTIAHADFLHEKINMYDMDFDIMLESKAKEQSLFKFLTLLEN